MTKFKLRIIVNQVSKWRDLFFRDSLFRNAIYLMASTAVMSVLGFVFWVFVAHLYKPADIGTASALISITTLLSNLSLLGFNSGIIRFLSGRKHPSQDINAAALTVWCASLVAGFLYVLVFAHLGGDIRILDVTWHRLLYVLLLSIVSLNSLTDAVFIANRRGEYHTIGYATFGTVKLILPLIFVPFGAVGVFSAYILGMLASLLVSIYLMVRGCNYRVIARPDWSFIKSMRRYTTNNYIAVVVAGLPAQLMPLLIIWHLGEASAAYFSMAWTMVNLLYIIPSAVTQSLLAESSYDNRKQAEHLHRTIRLLAMLLIPGVIGAIAVSPMLLTLFGPAYRANGTTLFQVLALSTFFIAVSSVGTTMLNVERRAGGVLIVQLVTTMVIGGAAIYLVRYGLIGVGLAFLLGSAVSSLLVGILWYHRPKASAQPNFPESHGELKVLLRPYGIDMFTARALGNGSSNSTTLISHGSRQYVLRIYTPEATSDKDIRQELRFMEYLSTRSLCVPKIITAKSGATLMHCTNGTTVWQYMLMEYISGQHPHAYSPSVIRCMAAAQARLHVYGQTYARKNRKLRRAISLPLYLKQLVLGWFTPVGFSHFDYDGSNVLFSDERLACILDFEGMRYGPLIGCLYFTLKEINSTDGDIRLLSQYISEYSQIRPLSICEGLILRVALALRCGNVRLLRLKITHA